MNDGQKTETQHGASDPDLSLCDREPIHIPGAVQPHGALLAVEPADFRITFASANLGSFLGIDVAAALGQPLSTLVGEEVTSLLPKAAHARRVNPGDTGLDAGLAGARVRLLPFVSTSGLICTDIVRQAETSIAQSPLLQAQRVIQSLRLARTAIGMCRIAVNDIRRLTGFDRVMVYRFDNDGCGDIIAENHIAGVESFLGLKYPASDIPQQARRLYMLHRLRVIPDVNAAPVALLTQPGRDAADLDLSASSLRAASPVHLTYLRNMGVTATAVVSLIVGGRLWGMLVCHHNTPWHISPELRAVLDLIGQVMSVVLGTLNDGEVSACRLLRQSALSAITTMVAKPEHTLANALAASASDLLSLVPAHGVVVSVGDRIAAAGRTPAPEAYRSIMATMAGLSSDDLAATDALPKFCEASAPLDGFAGALMLPLLSCANGSIVWFRQELNLTVTWAGKPEKLVPDMLTGRLEPRRSFASWSEEVRGRSDPWTDIDLGAARDLRRILDEAMVRRNEGELLLRVRDHDPLTGLPNRRAIDGHLKAASTFAAQPAMTLAVVNVDRFRKVNQLLGHSSGDALLVQIGHRLQVIAGPNEMVARIGTDEFVVLTTNCVASELGTRVAAVFNQPFEIAKQVLQMYASIGVANNAVAGDPLGLLHAAETAMRQAKTAGGNRLSVFEATLRTEASRQLVIEQSLDAALRSHREQFYLAFQPIVTVATGALRSWEVLIRWRHPVLGNVPPGEFIPIAENCGLICAIGDLVLEESLRHLVELPPSSEPDEQDVYLSVNVSPLQLIRKGFAAEIATLLSTRGITPSRLCIEITEGVFTNADAVTAIAEIRKLGVLVAVDDFGVGHSSLSALQRLPADVVKLDRSFLPELDTTLVTDRSFLSAVVALAHTTGLKVVMEGVETQLQLDAVVLAGVDAIQGYLFARPMPSEVAVALSCQPLDERSWNGQLETARGFARGVRLELDPAGGVPVGPLANGRSY